MALLSVILEKSITANAAPGNIQNFPTPTIYQLAGGSYDAFNKYRAPVFLNGLILGNISHLGASWHRSAYVDRANAFGVIAFDQYGPVFSAYTNGAVLLGLNQGNGDWSGPYVDRNNWFPGIAYDTMASYSVGQQIDPQGTLNAGADNNAGSVHNTRWNGGYIDGFGGLPGCDPSLRGLDPITLNSPTPGIQLLTPGTGGMPYGGAYGFQFVAKHDLDVTALGRWNAGVTLPPGYSAESIFMDIVGLDDGNQGEALLSLTPATVGQMVYSCVVNSTNGNADVRLKKATVTGFLHMKAILRSRQPRSIIQIRLWRRMLL